jgi:class 3 adenylate cyclase
MPSARGIELAIQEDIEATFCFIDIAGYTALTDTHGEHAAADLVQSFEELLNEAIGSAGILHELIGDCAFVVFPDPIASEHVLSNLFQLIGDRQSFPVVRAGLHHGSALLRNNRYFGSTINLAARVSAEAKGGQILCTETVAKVLIEAKLSELKVEHQGKSKLRNLPEPVDLYELSFAGLSREYVIDPVCKMQVNREEAAGELQFNNKKYFFCSLKCVQQFANSPTSYI